MKVVKITNEFIFFKMKKKIIGPNSWHVGWVG